MSYGKEIKSLRKQRGFTQDELGEKIGVSKQAISMYECESRTPTPDDLANFADIFDVDINVIYGRKTKAIKVPVLGYVAAGIPIEAITEILDYEEIDPRMTKDGSEYFALQIKGHSMEPKISNGDVVIVRQQPDVDSGQIAIICINGDDATCKRIMKQDNGILLVPLNPSYSPTFYSHKEIEEIPITILGRVVELRAKF